MLMGKRGRFLGDINEIKSKTMNNKSMELSLSYKHHAKKQKTKKKIKQRHYIDFRVTHTKLEKL